MEILLHLVHLKDSAAAEVIIREDLAVVAEVQARQELLRPQALIHHHKMVVQVVLV